MPEEAKQEQKERRKEGSAAHSLELAEKSCWDCMYAERAKHPSPEQDSYNCYRTRGQRETSIYCGASYRSCRYFMIRFTNHRSTINEAYRHPIALPPSPSPPNYLNNTLSSNSPSPLLPSPNKSALLPLLWPPSSILLANLPAFPFAPSRASARTWFGLTNSLFS